MRSFKDSKNIDLYFGNKSSFKSISSQSLTPTKETIRDGRATVSESWMNLKNCLASSKINFSYINFSYMVGK